MPSGPDVNPADDRALIRALLDRVAALERMTGERRDRVYLQRGQIMAFTAGSTTLTFNYLAGGIYSGSGTARYIVGYTPVVSHVGWVICSPEVNIWLGRDSVP